MKPNALSNSNRPEGAIDVRGYMFRDEQTWQLAVRLPNWIAFDMETAALEAPILALARVQPFSDYCIFKPEDCPDGYRYIFLEQRPTNDDLAEAIADIEDEAEATRLREAQEAKDYAMRALLECDSVVDFIDLAVDYVTQGVILSTTEYESLMNSVIQRAEETAKDRARRGHYVFDYNGKRIEGVNGEYHGDGKWSLSVVGLNTGSSYSLYTPELPSWMPHTPTMVVYEQQLDSALWMLANMLAVGRNWTCFIDVTRPRLLGKTKIK